MTVTFDVMIIRDRLERIAGWEQHLAELAVLPAEEFFDPRNTAAAESFLRRSLEALFDMGRHVLARLGRLDLAQEYKAIARGLVQAGVVGKDLQESLIRMAGYRNRLVHLYHEVTAEELREIVVHHRSDIVACARQIASFVKNQASESR